MATHTVWVVILGQGSWQKCYGTFDSYDIAIEWLRANQFVPADCSVLPLNGVDA